MVGVLGRKSLEVARRFAAWFTPRPTSRETRPGSKIVNNLHKISDIFLWFTFCTGKLEGSFMILRSVSKAKI